MKNQIQFKVTVALEHNNVVFFRLFAGLLVCVIEAMNTKGTAYAFQAHNCTVKPMFYFPEEIAIKIKGKFNMSAVRRSLFAS